MTNPSQFLETLKSSPVFQGIPEEMLVSNLANPTLEHYSAGQTILVAGQSNHKIYLIISGRLRIQSKEKDVNPLAVLGTGECTGEMSMMGGAPVATYVIADTDCELMAIEHKTMWGLINSSHAAANNMLRILTNRIRNTNLIAAENLEKKHGFFSEELVDKLTGLYTEHWMREKFERYLHRSQLDGSHCSLMFFDIDKLDEYGETYGLLGADQALRSLAYKIRSCLRPHDEATRIEEEHFAVLLPSTSLSQSFITADRIRLNIARSVIELPTGDALPAVTISVGVTEAVADDTFETLVERAKSAFLIACRSGGNCVKSAA